MKLQDWQQAFKFVRGIARGVRRGQVFPAPGRVGVQAAPGGSRIVQTATPGGWNELGRWEITEHTIPVRGLSAALRVLHLSDVHLRRDEPWVNQLSGEILQMCAATPPDVIVLTGDVLARGFDMAVVHRFLGALPTARYGTYAVIGNWEYWALTPDGRSPHDPGYLGNESDQKAKRREEWTAVLAEHGIPLLNNRSVRVGPIRVAGTDDILAGDPDIAAAYAELDGTPTLTLTHSPAMFDDLSHPDVFAVLAGHTHAGQVRLPVVGPFFLPKGSGDYPWGWYQGLDGAWLFVHRGIGWSVAPVRWRAAPEIAWIMVKPT